MHYDGCCDSLIVPMIQTMTTDPLMELKVTLSEVVKSVHAIEAVMKGLEGQKTILTNRCYELQAEIRRLNPVCTCPSGHGSLRHPCPVHP